MSTTIIRTVATTLGSLEHQERDSNLLWNRRRVPFTVNGMGTRDIHSSEDSWTLSSLVTVAWNDDSLHDFWDAFRFVIFPMSALAVRILRQVKTFQTQKESC
jgi:hypothetical protein